MNPGLAHIVKASGIAVLLGLLTSMPAAAALIVVKGGGTSDPASIQSFVDILWTDLSNPNNGSPSSAVGVRSTGTVAVPQSSGVALAFSCKFNVVDVYDVVDVVILQNYFLARDQRLRAGCIEGVE